MYHKTSNHNVWFRSTALIIMILMFLILFTKNVCSQQFLMDNQSMNQWISLMPATSHEVKSLPEKTRNDILCMAMNIYHEARGQNLKERIAVAHVVLNRTKHKDYGGDICYVTFQYNYKNGVKKPQFSWILKSPRQAREQKAWHDSQDLALMVVTGKTSDPTRGAIYFHHRTVSSVTPHQVVYIGSSKFFHSATSGRTKKTS